MVIKKLNGLDIVDATKDQANGIAGLNAEGRIPANQLPTPYGTDLYLSRELMLQYFTSWLDALEQFTVSWTEYTLNSNVFSTATKIVPITDTRLLFCDDTHVYTYDLETEELSSIVSYDINFCDITVFNGKAYVSVFEKTSPSSSSTIYGYTRLYTLNGTEWQLLYQHYSDNRRTVALHNISNEWLIFAVQGHCYVWNKNNEVITIDISSLPQVNSVNGNKCTTDGIYVYIKVGFAQNATPLYRCTETEIMLLNEANKSAIDAIELIGKTIVGVALGTVYQSFREIIFSEQSIEDLTSYSSSALYAFSYKSVLTCSGIFTHTVYNTENSLYRLSTVVRSLGRASTKLLSSTSDQMALFSTGKFVFATVGDTLKLWLNGEFVDIKTNTPISCVGATRDIICAVYNNKVYIGKCPALL